MAKPMNSSWDHETAMSGLQLLFKMKIHFFRDSTYWQKVQETFSVTESLYIMYLDAIL